MLRISRVAVFIQHNLHYYKVAFIAERNLIAVDGKMALHGDSTLETETR